MYLFFKYLHMTTAGLSVFLFFLRFYWRISASKKIEQKWVKIAPHMIDTVLLICAVALCFILSQYPLLNNWLSEKLILLFAYIVFGFMALKPTQKPKLRWVAFVLAVACVSLIVKLALSKDTYLLG